MALENQFRIWMGQPGRNNGNTYKPNTINIYCRSLKGMASIIENLNLIHNNGNLNLIHNNLFDHLNLTDFQKDKTIITNNANFASANIKNGNGSYNASLNLYEQFLMQRAIPTTNQPNSYTKTDFLSEVFITEPDYDTIANLLKRKKNLILQGAPGVGKTFTAKKLAYSIMGQKDDERVQMIQFHQSYSYEDFIMGYRPNGTGFELKTGAFYDFCKKAQSYEENDYFFIIDEINRGNLSKIFGELFMLIEHDKRGENHSMQLLYSNKDEEFYIPENVHIIGMMNTADRSLAMLDYALRRRFAFYEMQPAFDTGAFIKYQGKNLSKTADEIVKDSYKKYNGKIALYSNNNNNNVKDKLKKLIETVKKLNEEIQKDPSLGAGFRIGHSYFVTEETITDNWLKEVVEYEIIPLLQEYWFDENSEVKQWTGELRKSIK